MPAAVGVNATTKEAVALAAREKAGAVVKENRVAPEPVK